ncbi:MAG: tetratricopeptide repeat protein, partial [Candidatus Lokiarchaeota archaeon]|nr:tetratricopeptide repeat protein [Candidatus Lokiarchaeota archaeon]
MIKKLIICYSDDDREIALKLREDLNKLDFDIWIAHEDLKGSVIFGQTIMDAIDEADGLILLWSAAASKSKEVLEEVRIARVFLKPIFPISADDMKRIPKLPEEIRDLQVIHENNFDLSIIELTKRLLDPKRRNINYLEIAQNGYIPKPPNPYFVGRNGELKALFVDTWGFHGQNKKGIPIAISGLAGIGKTQLSVAFAYRFNLFFTDGVFWIDTPNGIVQEYGKIGKHLRTTKYRDERPSDFAVRVKEKFSLLSNALLIFDNVVNFNEFREWCPGGNKSCSVIFTTRKSPRSFPVRVINLPELDEESAYKLIISRRPDSDTINSDVQQKKALQKICNIMGNHPLALELCASYLQSTLIQPTDLLEDLQGDPLELLANQPQFQEFLGQGDANVLEVLKRSYESLDTKLVEPYFMVLSWFGPHRITANLIKNAYSNHREAASALSELAANSLIHIESDNTITLPPLVAQFGKSLQKSISVRYYQKFIEIIIHYLKENKKNLHSDIVGKEIPHIIEAINVSRQFELWNISIELYGYYVEIVTEVDKQIEILKEVFNIFEKKFSDQEKKLPGFYVKLGKALRTKGMITDALEKFRKSETLYNKFPEVDPADVASLQFELGDAYLALGKYKEAKEKLNSALKTALEKARFEVNTPEVTRIKQAIARRALFLGKYDEAEKSFSDILEHRRQFFKSHPNKETSAAVASSYADLSRIDLERGHFDDANTNVNMAFEAIKDFYTENDPEYINLLLLLGNINLQDGKYQLSEKHLERAQLNFSTIFGKNHPSYARTLVSISELNRKLGNFKKATDNIHEAIDVFEKIYGAHHPFLAEGLNIKGKIHDHLCQFTEEKQVWERVLDIQSKAYAANPNHPALAMTHYDYGSLFLKT